MADQSPYYLFASLAIDDMEAFQGEYGAPVFPQLMAAGAEVLAATADAEPHEGNYGNTWSVLIKFPSRDAFETWFGSSEYEPLIAVRQKLTDTEKSLLLGMPAVELPA
ncbi:MAG: DUF1330 domain-containing protein [Pseudomonadota bacterium]